MREFQDKERRRRALYSKASLVVLAVLVVLFAKGTWNVYQKANESRRNSDLTQKEYDSLKVRHDYLEAQIGNLSTPEGKEREIRQNFQVSKEGEQIVVIVDSTSTVNTEVEEQGGMQKAWNSFWGIFHKKN